jgi:hypothetical protein
MNRACLALGLCTLLLGACSSGGSANRTGHAGETGTAGATTGAAGGPGTAGDTGTAGAMTGTGGDTGAAGSAPGTAGSSTGAAGSVTGTAGATGGAAGAQGGLGTAGTTGAAGRSPAVDGGAIDAYIPQTLPDGVLVNVVNGCSFDLYINASGMNATLMPDGAKIAAGGGHQVYTAPDNWPAARITAYTDAALHTQLDKVELTIANKAVNYNITYVDWVGLPVEMITYGSGSDCKKVGCYVKQADLVSTCPGHLLQGKQCLSAYHYCASAANAADPFCHALDPQFAKCAAAGCPMATTTQVYGCNGPYGNNPKWCAALNRGRPMNPDDPDASLYYTTPPYNAYAKWVHDTCPGIYAFPYDDYGKSNQSSFHDCTGATQLDVVFCPNG